MSKHYKNYLCVRILASLLSLLLIVAMVPINIFDAAAEDVATCCFIVTDGFANIENAKVTVMDRDSVIADGVSDKDGKFIFSVEPSKVYNYSITKFGYKSASGTTAEVKDGEITVEITEKEKSPVYGVVLDSEGNIIEGVSIVIENDDGFKKETTTNSSGGYTFVDMYKGEFYRVTASKSGYISQEQLVSFSDPNTFIMSEKVLDNIYFSDEEQIVEYCDKQQFSCVAKNSNGVTADNYNSSNEKVATIDEKSGLVTVTGVGETTITAVKNETDSICGSVAVCKITVIRGSQADLTWEIEPPSVITWKSDYSNAAFGGSGDGKITYTVSDNSIADIDNNGKLDIKKTGEITITATKSGVQSDGKILYEDKESSYVLNIEKSSIDERECYFRQEGNSFSIRYGESFSNEVIFNFDCEEFSEGLEVEYSSSNEEIVTVDSDGQLNVHSACLSNEPVTITANIIGNNYYKEKQLSYTLFISKANQKTEFSFEKENSEITFGDKFQNIAYGGDSEDITYYSKDNNIATVDKYGNVTAHKAGMVEICAVNGENDSRYEKVEISYTLTIKKYKPIVSFEKNSDIQTPGFNIVYGENFENRASINIDTEEKLKYSSSDESTASVDGNGKVTFYKAGKVVITASMDESDCYEGVSKSYDINIEKANREISFEKTGEALCVKFNEGDNVFENKATAPVYNEGRPIYELLSSEPEGLIKPSEEFADNGKFEILGAGIIIIQATFENDECYNEVKAQYVLTVSKADQTIAFPKSEYFLLTGQSFDAPQTTGVGGSGKISYKVKSQEGNIVKYLDSETGQIILTNEPGEVTIEATKSDDKNYNATTTTYTLIISEWTNEKLTDCYSIEGDKLLNESDWFTGDINIVAKSGYLVSDSRMNDDITVWKNMIPTNINKDGVYSFSFYVKRERDGAISELITEDQIKRDTEPPTGKVVIEDKTTLLNKILSVITRGEEKEKISFTINSSDSLSGVSSVKYFVDKGSLDLMTKEELDETDKWISYTENKAVEVEKNKNFVIYAKLIDAAGNYTYISSNGVIFDGQPPKVTFDIKTDQTQFHWYNKNVNIAIDVKDADVYSGIKSITYEVTCDGAITQNGDLFQFENENPSYDDLVNEWNSEEFNSNIIVDSSKNNSDNVEVIVYVEDNSGNKEEYVQPLSISVSQPKLDVSFIDDPEKVDEDGVVEYYNANRKAKIVITDRTSLFDENNDSIVNVIVTAKDGDAAKDKATFNISNWETVEVNGNPDKATHTAYIDFTGSANYSFKVEYKNKADFCQEYETSKNFVVDHDNPCGSVYIGDDKWDKLAKILTFGFWSNNSVYVFADVYDSTSPIKSLEYYKTDQKDALTREQLEKVSWIPYKPFTVEDDELFTVYLKITDYAGHTEYISSSGYIVDKNQNESRVDITLPQTEFYDDSDIGVYNSDVEVCVTAYDAYPYSGLNKVEYTIYDEASTEYGILFDYSEYLKNYNVSDITYDRLVSDISKVVTIKSDDFNSDNIVLYVKATDNAGNVFDNQAYLKIDNVKPKIEISFDNNQGIVDIDEQGNERGYFDKSRRAKIVVTERTSSFNEAKADEGIFFEGYDANGNSIILERESMLAGEWVTEEKIDAADNATHTKYVYFTEDANYNFQFSYTDDAGNEAEEISIVNESNINTLTPFHFTVDTIPPEYIQVKVDDNLWDRTLSILTFGLWKRESVYVSAKATDSISPVRIDYYKTTDEEGKGQLLDENALSKVDWKEYTGEFLIDSDEQFVVYVRATDKAGNYSYQSSNGVIVDKTPCANIEFSLEKTNITHNNVNVYKDDTVVEFAVDDRKDKNTNNSSGLKQIDYTIKCDGSVTKSDNYWKFDKETPLLSELVYAKDGKIKVFAAENNSCDVEVTVIVTDNAGNVSEKSVKLDIDVTPPVIKLDYGADNARKVVGDHGYFSQSRTAVIEIIERTGHFNSEYASNSIKITALDAKGNTVIKDCKSLISDWHTVESDDADSATHTATIHYDTDANYEFSVSYCDMAGNNNSSVITYDVTPYKFTVDRGIPTGSVSVSTLGTWNKLIEVITFGLWSNESLTISAVYDDNISPIESVNYIMVDDTTAKSREELLSINSWQPFKTLTISEDEQFVCYICITDYAGNVEYISTNGIILDFTEPLFEYAKPEIMIDVEEIRGDIYNNDVRVAVKVLDPKVGSTNAYSGLKNIRYEVLNMGTVTQEGVLYNFTVTNPVKSELLQEWEKYDAIIVDSALNNSNDVIIKVYAEDNAGNYNEMSVSIKIDCTKPTVFVSYDNNNGDTTFSDSVYFNSDRTATIAVYERNFTPDKFIAEIENKYGVVPTLSDWETVEGTGNGDDTVHIAELVFSADGDYKINFSCTDEAGNRCDVIDYGDSLAATAFTIDKTLPVVSVSFDNNDVLNQNYYKAKRTATLTVTEHNFETSRMNVKLEAIDEGVAKAVPQVSDWKSNGDVHTATIEFTEDAFYTLDFSYIDKAGNSIDEFEKQSFYIDKTNPSISITNIVDRSANNDDGDIGFLITATDTNFDIFEPVLTAVVLNNGEFETKQLDIGEIYSLENGKCYEVKNIEADGIYTIMCTVTDKAGNSNSEVTLQSTNGTSYVESRTKDESLLVFSVNRFGSTFYISDYTSDVIDKYYIQNVGRDLVINEVNVNFLSEKRVTLNGQELSNDYYTVSKEGGNGSWVQYKYSVKKAVFEEEGEYELVISSKDEAANYAFSDVKNAAVHFVVDRTAPVVTVAGLAENGKYRTDKQIVTLMPTDDGGSLNSIKVSTVDNNGTEIMRLLELSGTELDEMLESEDGKLTVELSEGLYQNVKIVCNDKSVSDSGETNTFNRTFKNISISSSAILIFWSNKLFRWISILGVIFFAVAVTSIAVFKKRRKVDL